MSGALDLMAADLGLALVALGGAALLGAACGWLLFGWLRLCGFVFDRIKEARLRGQRGAEAGERGLQGRERAGGF